MAKNILLLGDSNVLRWTSRLGAAYLPTVEYTSVLNSDELPAALSQVQPSYQIVVFAGLTNIIVHAGSTTSGRIGQLEAIEKSIKSTFDTIKRTMETIQDPSYFLAMPTVRSRPQWYLPLHSEICQTILRLLKSVRPTLRPLRAFNLSGSDLDSDGIHLNAMAGIPYVQDLVDQPRALLDIASSEGPSDSFNFVTENLVSISTTLSAHELQIRVLKDQLLLTRCQHAEEACGRINVDNLNRFIIIGAPYLPLCDQLQAKLRSQVAFYIRAISPRLTTDVIHVRQFRGRAGGIYDVEMSSPASSNRVRHAYGLFFRREGNGPPPALSKISITNSLTYASRVRVKLMKEVAKRHKLSNPDMTVFVTNYLPRPTLKMREQRGPMQTFTFCETMQKFSHHLSAEFLASTTKFANVQIPREDLTNLFLLLSPDLLHGAGFTPSSPSEPQPPPTSRARTAQTPHGSTSATQAATPSSSSTKKRRSSISTNPRPVFSKRGRPSRVQFARGRGKGKIRGRLVRSPEALEATETMDMDNTSAPSGEDEGEREINVVPIDFSQEAFVED